MSLFVPTVRLTAVAFMAASRFRDELLCALFWNREFAAKRLGLTDAQTEHMMDALKGIFYPDEDFDWKEI